MVNSKRCGCLTVMVKVTGQSKKVLLMVKVTGIGNSGGEGKG